MAKELTEKQEAFLEALFGDCLGDPEAAAIAVGYQPNRASAMVTHLKDEIIERSEFMMAMNAPRAAMSIVGIIKDPTALGNKDKLAAARDLLDRVGLARSERVDMKSLKPVGIFVLPAKALDDSE